uniref:MULE transposase domain-containing protein n=1 Tax=Arundo donax TaxID=35708 RepID=A0A0A9DJV3_ARUDO
MVISNPTTYDVKCTAPGCTWRVHGYLPKGETSFVASIMVQHSCSLKSTLLKHRNMTAKYVADYLYYEIVHKTGMSPFAIMHAIENRLGYEITYDMAWRAKQKALERRFGTYKDSYHNLPFLLEVMQSRNPGTIIAIDNCVNQDGDRILQRAFWSFGCMIEAFKHCRHVLCVDGTFLTAMYKGQILTAIGVDGENQVVPIAFAFVECERTESWLWFLRWVKRAVVMDRPNVCILHDRHAGLLSAIDMLQMDHNDEAFWQNLHSRWCMRHLETNYHRQFKSKRLMDMFKKLCKHNRRRKFDMLWAELDKLTGNHMNEVKKQPILRDDDEPKGLDPLPNEPVETRRRRRGGGRRVKCFSDLIKDEPMEKWVLIADTDGSRFGIMTNNLVKVYN